MEEHQKTAISKAYPDRILVKGFSVTELAGQRSFGDLVYLLMTGNLPDGQQGELIEAMLVCCAEHTLNSPSTHVARAVANCGVPLQSAVAAGISAIGENHGGAGEALARAIQEISATSATLNLEDQAALVIASFQQKGMRVPGLGHRLHNLDPRTERLVGLARQWGLAGHYIALVEEIARQVSFSSSKPLPVNVDGALAGLLSDLGINWHYAKAVFIIARSAGLAAHVVEELETGKPFKFIAATAIDYAGPEERALPQKE